MFRHFTWMNIENTNIAKSATHCTLWHRTSDQNIEETYVKFQMIWEHVQFCVNVKQMFHPDIFIQKTYLMIKWSEEKGDFSF